MLDDETLAVWMGEFGRAPRINKNVRRDHCPKCSSLLLAGGGVKQGFVYGRSDKTARNPDATIHDLQDRPRPISSGRPVHAIIA